jgi:hypothetical protein
MYTESQIYTKNLYLWMDQKILAIWNIYFDQIGPKIKKWEQNISKNLIIK